jgi:hypothetical protein
MRSVDLKVHIDPDGTARGATAQEKLNVPLDRLWAVIVEVDKFPERIPMIHRVRLDGKRATVDLKFKLSLFSVGFHFVVDVIQEEKKWLELRWVSGEPRGIKLRFDLEEADDGKATILTSTGEFDVMSLGWLAKYFLKHHPEIQFGVIPGVAVGLLESMRKAAGAS